MYLKLKPIGLFSIFLVISYIIGITTEKIEPVNFVVMHDDGDTAVSNLIDFAIKHYKKKFNLGEIYRIRLPLMNPTLSTFLKPFLKLVKIKTNKPRFAIDFTRDDYTGGYALAFMQHHKFPSVSTNVQLKLAQSWDNFSDSMKKYLIRISPPETIMSDIALKIIKNSFAEALVQHGNFSFGTKFKPKPRSYGLEALQFKILDLKTNDGIKNLLSRKHFEPRSIFIIGSSNEAREMLDSLSEFSRPNGSPFSNWYSWSHITTHVNDKFERPDHVENIIIFEPEIKESTGLRKGIEEFGTNNLTDLFYFEVFRSVLQTYTNMKKSGDWKDWVNRTCKNELDLRKNLIKILKNENNDNIFGKFKEDMNNTFQPNITFKLQLHAKPNLNLTIGEIVDNNILIKNESLWNRFFAWKFINVGIVSDPPFVISNETCLTNVTTVGESNICYKGLIPNVMHIMHKELDKTSFIISIDEPYGKLVNSEEWSGTMGNLQNQIIDMAFGAFAITTEREKTIDFSEPFFFDTRNNQSYAFAFQKGKFLSLQYNVSRIISKMKMQGDMERLKTYWFEEYKCNCTLSNEH